MNNKIFENLFVLELANNHWGSLSRGKQIVREFAKVVKENKIKAAIKLQFRDVDNFIHKDFKQEGKDTELTALPKRTRYIQKTSKTKLTYDEFKELIDYIKKHDCIPMSTPFDEKSVDWCVQMNLSLIKIASSYINDWLLLNKIASTKKPVIISTGGANDKQIDDVILDKDNVDATSRLQLVATLFRKEPFFKAATKNFFYKFNVSPPPDEKLFDAIDSKGQKIQMPYPAVLFLRCQLGEGNKLIIHGVYAVTRRTTLQKRIQPYEVDLKGIIKLETKSSYEKREKEKKLVSVRGTLQSFDLKIDGHETNMTFPDPDQTQIQRLADAIRTEPERQKKRQQSSQQTTQAPQSPSTSQTPPSR
jgi:hypothetical protein